MRSALVIAIAVVIAMIAYVAITFGTIWFAGNYDNGKSADAIVVMGAAQYDGQPSPLLESRLSTALTLWQDKRAPVIALTGGKRDGDRFTESEAGRTWLINAGVPGDAILMESIGQSTWQSVEALAPVLKGASRTRVLVVSSDWHIGRSAASLEDVGITVVGSSSPKSRDSWDLYEWTRETVGVSVGRIIGFRQLFSISG
jgi:uncharacterized SAM-binding protein YcdF (DUF218 family)